MSRYCDLHIDLDTNLVSFDDYSRMATETMELFESSEEIKEIIENFQEMTVEDLLFMLKFLSDRNALNSVNFVGVVGAYNDILNKVVHDRLNHIKGDFYGE